MGPCYVTNAFGLVSRSDAFMQYATFQSNGFVPSVLRTLAIVDMFRRPSAQS